MLHWVGEKTDHSDADCEPIEDQVKEFWDLGIQVIEHVVDEQGEASEGLERLEEKLEDLKARLEESSSSGLQSRAIDVVLLFGLSEIRESLERLIEAHQD